MQQDAALPPAIEPKQTSAETVPASGAAAAAQATPQAAAPASGLPAGTSPAPATGPVEGDIQHLNRIMKQIRTCMLVTHGSDGLHARPMGTAEIDFDFNKGEAIYFVTHADSIKVGEIRANPEVALVFSDDGHQRWASVSATAQVVDDKEKARELWSPVFNAWFPNGPDTPGVTLVKAVPSCGCYWEGSHLNRLHILFAALASRVTRQPIKQGMTQETKHVIFPTPGATRGAVAAPTTPGATQTVA